MPTFQGVRRSRDVESSHASEIELEPMVGKSEMQPQMVALAPQETRSGFIRKVYGILLAQLAVTVIVAGYIVLHGKQMMHTRPSAVMSAVTISSGLTLLITLIFSCCPAVMRNSPGNYGLLGLFTVAESVLVGFACLHYTMGSVILCFGITSLVVLGLTVYAMRTKSDLTGGGPYLLCALLVLLGTGLFLSVLSWCGLSHNPLFNGIQILYAAGGALVFSMFLIYDTQLILGGSHQHEFSIDDYAMAAVSLYLDILQLFLALLRLIGREDDGGL